MRLAKVRGFFHPIIAAFASLSVLVIFWIGGYFVIKKVITIGEFIAFNGTIGYLLMPTIFIGWIMSMLQRSRASLERIGEVIGEANVLRDINVDSGIKTLSGDIRIDNLSFSYNKEKEILSNFSLSIKSGEMVAIIGEVGVGKSTVINLMQRIYAPPKNSIFYDGNDVFRIPLEILHANINYVSQEPHIFSGSIRDNISYIDQVDTTLDAIIWAAKFADIAKDIESFPNAYDTLIGENGITLSGGQKQRIALARAIINRPKILMLDNVFSAVDTETEDNILQNLLQLKGHITTIIVAHRVSTLKHCDKIILLKEGMVLASGTHEELMHNKDYMDIYEKQI